MFKDVVEVLHPGVEIGRDFVFVLRIRMSKGETRPDGLLDVQHGGSLGPSVLVVREFGKGRDTAVSSAMKRLSDRRMLHHDTAIEGRAARATVQPDYQRVRDDLLLGLKEPKHNFPMTISVVHGQRSGVHSAGKVRIRWFHILKTLDKKVLWRLFVVPVLHAACCADGRSKSNLSQI